MSTSPCEDYTKVFETIQRFNTDFQDEQINVRCKYVKSRRSGLNVIFAKVPSDCVFGTFVFLTDTTGPKPLAACVQRLTACGSQNFPANFVERVGREISMGFAGTILHADRSVYTVNAQNDRGLIAMLPPYLDSIFLPLLNKSDFEAQIYTPKGNKGRPAGAMYKELVAAEGSDKTGLGDFQSNIYSKTCLYHHNVRGRADALPTISLEEVRAYHFKHYLPSNCFMIFAGDIDTDDILQVLNSFEAQLPHDMLKTSLSKPTMLAVPTSKPALLQPDLKSMLEACRALDAGSKAKPSLSVPPLLSTMVRFTSEVEHAERSKLAAAAVTAAPLPELLFTVHVVMQGPDILVHEEWTAFQLISRLLKQTLNHEVAGDLDPMDLSIGSKLTGANCEDRKWPLTTLTWRSIRETQLEETRNQYRELIERLLTPGDPLSMVDQLNITALLDTAASDYRDQLSWRAEYDTVMALTCWAASCPIDRQGAIESFQGAVHPAVDIRKLRKRPVPWWGEFIKKNFAHGVFLIEKSRFVLDSDRAGFDSSRRFSRWTLSSAGSDRGIPKDVKELREDDWQHSKDQMVEEYFHAIGFQDPIEGE